MTTRLGGGAPRSERQRAEQVSPASFQLMTGCSLTDIPSDKLHQLRAEILLGKDARRAAVRQSGRQSVSARNRPLNEPPSAVERILYRRFTGNARPSTPGHGRASILQRPAPPGSVPAPAASRPAIDNPRNPAGIGARPCGPPRRS